jgi:hypothetical protein
MQTQVLNAGSSREIDEVFTSIVGARPDALLVATSAFFADHPWCRAVFVDCNGGHCPPRTVYSDH